MLRFTNYSWPTAFIAIGALTLVLAQSMEAQACHHGKKGGHSMSGGYSMGGSYSMGGYAGGGYTGGTGQSYGTTGSYRGQSPSTSGSQNSSSLQEAITSSTPASLNNPATALAHASDLSLTSKQVNALEKMVKSGKQRAALVLTQAQRKQLAQIVGIVPKARST